MPVQFPNETVAYRTARNHLLDEELALRTQIEKVARLRRGLPAGGHVQTDYAFAALDGTPTPLSSLFTTDRQTVAIYSLMFRGDAQAPCPMCCSMLDGLAGQSRHIGDQIDLVVVAAASPAKLAKLSKARGWSDLKILSAQGTTYQSDYHAQMPDGSQLPMMNVFVRSDGKTHHFWGSEGFFADVDGHPRHVDQIWPLWNILDLTPDGRGTDWFPALSYPA